MCLQFLVYQQVLEHTHCTKYLVSRNSLYCYFIHQDDLSFGIYAFFHTFLCRVMIGTIIPQIRERTLQKKLELLGAIHEGQPRPMVWSMDRKWIHELVCENFSKEEPQLDLQIVGGSMFHGPGVHRLAKTLRYPPTVHQDGGLSVRQWCIEWGAWLVSW